MVIGIDIDDTVLSTTEAITSSFGNSNGMMKSIKDAMQNYNIKIPISMINMEKWLQDVKVKDNAVGVINRLKEKGHTIIFITARNSEYFKDPEVFTIKQLQSFGFSYDKLIVGQMDGKYLACKENNIELMIDDKISTCEGLVEKGIDSIVYNVKTNEDIETKLKRFDTWLEIEKYIDELK